MSSKTNHLESTSEKTPSRRPSLPVLAVVAGLVSLSLMVITSWSSRDGDRDPDAPRGGVGEARGNERDRASEIEAHPLANDVAALDPRLVEGVAMEAVSANARLTGIVVDAGGHQVPGARVTALRTVEGRCPADFYDEHGFSELDDGEGLRARADDRGAFVIDGAEPGVEYDFFVDMQGEDLWWIDACSTPAQRATAPVEDIRLVLPYGLVVARVELPSEWDVLRSEDVRFDVRLRVRRGPSDESVVGELGDQLRIAVEFDRPIEIVAEGTGLRTLTISDIAVSREVGRVEVPLRFESTGLAHRLTVVVSDLDGAPASDAWIYEVLAGDTPRFETLRSAGCSGRDDGKFVFEFLEARRHVIVAIPDADSGLAPAGSVIDLPPSSVRELHLDVVPGEFVEVRLPSTAPRITVLGLDSPELDFELGDLVEWVEAGRSSWERYRTFSPGGCYRSTFRLPVGRYELRYSVDGVEHRAPFEVESGYRARVNFEFTR